MERTEQHSPTPEARQRTDEQLNGVDTTALFETIDAIKEDPAKASCKFFSSLQWRGGTRSTCTISRYQLGGEDIAQNYSFDVDEPKALLGSDSAPNPQMLLYGALSACVLNTFVVNAAAKKIPIESLEIEIEGELDLRGFLGIDDSVNPGYEELTLICKVKGEGTEAQYQQCLEAGTKYSPNFQSITRPVAVRTRIQVL